MIRMSYVWSEQCDDVFQIVKNDLVEDKVLMEFDEKLHLLFATDASPYELSTILPHVTPD